jgi:hypothetical protein
MALNLHQLSMVLAYAWINALMLVDFTLVCLSSTRTEGMPVQPLLREVHTA